MNNIQTNKIDELIKSFLRNWEMYEVSDEYTAIKRSLSFTIKDELYTQYYSKRYSSNLKFYSIKKKTRFNIRELFIHSLFYLFFSIKWLVLLITNNKVNFIVINFIPDKNLSEIYIDNLIQNLSHNTKIIHLGMHYKKKLMFNPNFYCFPFFFYRLNEKINSEKVDPFFAKLNSLSENIDLKIPYKNFFNVLNHSLKSLAIYDKLLHSLSSKGAILNLIQDFDFIGLGFIINNVFQKYSIPTYSIDHAIIPYVHEFNNRTSNYYLVWGENEKLRLIKFCDIKSDNIKVVGNPQKRFKTVDNQITDKKIWLYLMNSYRYSIYHSELLSWNNFLKRIEKIHLLSKEIDDKIKIIVKPHPLDKIKREELPNDSISLVNDKIEKFISNTQLILFENTSIGIDLLQYEIPIANVYCGLETQFSSYTEIPLIKDFSTEEIFNMLNNNLKSSKRKKIFEQFYDPIEFKLYDNIPSLEL